MDKQMHFIVVLRLNSSVTSVDKMLSQNESLKCNFLLSFHEISKKKLVMIEIKMKI